MNITETQIKKFLRDAIISFFFWTGTLTPYMFLVVHTDFTQYLAWVSMQAIIVPPLGAISAVLFRWIDKVKIKFEIESLEKSGWTGMTVKEMLWDLKKQMDNLDTRETVLQKNVATLSEQLTGLIFQKKEKREEKKVSIATKALMISITAFIVSAVLGILELMAK